MSKKEEGVYDHYIAVDWSIQNMAIARMTPKSNKITVTDVDSDVAELIVYLKSLQGTKILTFEETTVSQWLYTELKDYVTRILVCDPLRNRLLSEGPKTDKIDASKLVQLLKANLLKEVFHSSDRFLNLRRLMSGYDDLVKAGVRWKNQRYSLLRACGFRGDEKRDIPFKTMEEQHVWGCLERQIENYEREKQGYENRFLELAKKYPEVRHQMGIPGIGLIGAVKVVAQVVSPHRFADAGHFLSYAGLVKLEKRSGMISYGRKKSRHCPELKNVYKTGSVTALKGNNPIDDCYRYLIQEKGYPDYQARHKVARRLAILSWGVLKSGKKYQRRHHVKVAQDV